MDEDTAPGDVNLVSIAEPDSPITHDGPDPKRLEFTASTESGVVKADFGVILVGIFAEGGPAIEEMCS